jgi:hypothetical protein
MNRGFKGIGQGSTRCLLLAHVPSSKAPSNEFGRCQPGSMADFVRAPPGFVCLAQSTGGPIMTLNASGKLSDPPRQFSAPGVFGRRMSGV